jgi:REP element-mobilizing transposase RayT
MKEYQSLSHTRWDCKYHVVFIPKRRKKRIFGAVRKHLGEMLHELAGHKGSKIVEGHLMPDHIHSVHQHTAVVGGIECSGLYQGKERDPDCAKLRRPTAQFHR